MSKKFALVFPGQGSQHLGMVSDLSNHFPFIKEIFAEASTILNYDLWHLVQEGPLEQLNQTEYTQPALLVAGVAVWKVWQKLTELKPNYLAGHSLGEYTALVCAGAIDFSTGVELVAARGRYMQVAVPTGQGAMAAIVGLENQDVIKACQTASENGQEVTPANFNSVGQIVIAGNAGAVDRAIEITKEMGAKIAKKLPMSVPSHCSLMKPASEQLQQKLATINIATPQIPVINNVDVSCYQEPNKIADALVRQLYSPVRWVELVKKLAMEGVETMIESGPGKVLTGLNRRIVPELGVVAIIDHESFQEALDLVQMSKTNA